MKNFFSCLCFRKVGSRALNVPAGKHKVIFSYEPAVFYWSLRISLLSLFLFICWLFFVKMRISQ